MPLCEHVTTTLCILDDYVYGINFLAMAIVLGAIAGILVGVIVSTLKKS